MSSETQNLLIGAAIAFLSSTITVIISHFLQTGRDIQAEKWEMEKQQRDDKKLIVIKRLETLEIEINGFIQDLQLAYNALRVAVFLQPPDIRGLTKNCGNPLTSFIEKQIELQTNSSYFNDEDLSVKINCIYNLADKYFDLYNKTIESAEEIVNDKAKLLSVRDEIMNFGIEIARGFADVYIKLDIVRINALECKQGIIG